MARYGVFCERDEQWPAESQSATGSREEEARHHGVQSPSQPDQGAAHRNSNVSSLQWSLPELEMIMKHIPSCPKVLTTSTKIFMVKSRC